MAATTTKKAPATKAPAKKTTTKATSAKKAPAKKASPKATHTKAEDKDLATFAEQAAWAYAGVLNDVVHLAVEAPKHVPTTREELDKTRESLVAQLRANMDKVVTTFNARLEAKAVEGRKAADELARDPRVERVTSTLKPVLDQAGNTRSQVKAAVTSVTKTANVAGEAANKQFGNVTAQAKGAVTSLGKVSDVAGEAANKQFGNVTAQAKGAMTSLGKVSDVAVEASRPQAKNARSQVKAATTSTRKTVGAAVEAGKKLAN